MSSPAEEYSKSEQRRKRALLFRQSILITLGIQSMLKMSQEDRSEIIDESIEAFCEEYGKPYAFVMREQWENFQ